jgi:DNA polymerase-3 subunit epsilon
MQITELINLFKKLKERNPTILLSGSLALFLQNVRLPRLPEDIDICLPYGDSFNMIEGMTAREIANYSNHIIEDSHDRWAYYYKGHKRYIKVDVFQAIEEKDNDENIIESNGILCTHQRDILKYKVSHALNGNEKHKADMLFILNNSGSVYPSITIERPIIFFDTETTGVDKVKDRIIELSTIKYFDDCTFEIKTQRFNPTIPIPQAATEVHGITDEDVADEPTFSDKASQLADYFSDCDLAGFNIINFDLPLLVEEFLRANVDIPFLADKKVVDALKIFYQKERRDLTSAYKFYCGKELNNAHSADIDTIATVEVLHDQIKKYQLSSSLNDLHNLCNEEGETLDYEGKFVRDEDGRIVFTFGQHKGEAVTDHIDYLQWMLRQNFANYTKMIIRKMISGELDERPF